MSVLLFNHVILYWHVLSGFSVDLQSNHAVAFSLFHPSTFLACLKIHYIIENPCWILTCRQYSWEIVMAWCSISYSRSPISPFYKLGESVKMLNADMPTIQTWQLLWNTQPWQHGVLSPIHHLVWMFKKTECWLDDCCETVNSGSVESYLLSTPNFLFNSLLSPKLNCNFQTRCISVLKLYRNS